MTRALIWHQFGTLLRPSYKGATLVGHLFNDSFDIKLENSSSERSCQAQPWVNHQIEARLQDAGAGSTQWLFAMVRSCGADALIELARNHASSFNLNARDETGRTILDLILNDANLAISDDAILRLREVGFRFGWQPIPYSKPQEADCSNNAPPQMIFRQFSDDTIFAHARFFEDSPQKRFWRERILDACQLGLDLDQSVIVFTSEYEPTEDFDDPQEPIYNIVPVKESDLWSGKLDAEIEVYAPFLKSEPTTARHLLEHDNLLSFAPTRAADRAP